MGARQPSVTCYTMLISKSLLVVANIMFAIKKFFWILSIIESIMFAMLHESIIHFWSGINGVIIFSNQWLNVHINALNHVAYIIIICR